MKNTKWFHNDRMEFQEELKDFLANFEQYSQKFFAQKIKEAHAYHPLIVQFYKDLADFSSGGKRMRAYLVYLGYLTATSQVSRKADLKKVLPVSLAIEIVHSFLLIHDDIIDRSDKRRGKPTIHERYQKNNDYHYGVSQAIILGDIACFEALRLVDVADFDASKKVKSQQKLLEVILETGYGEALDVLYTYKQPNLSQIWKVMDLKTARYSLVGPLIIGSLLGDGNKNRMAALTKFGLAAGIAFQLADDVLGLFANEKVIGKPSDLAEGKNTLLIYKTRELAGPKDKIILDTVWGNKNASHKETKQVQEIVIKCGALAWCHREQERLVREAKGVIGQISSDRKLQSIFGQIADFTIDRQK